MLLLLDECVPRPLRRDLIGHDARHVVDMGWSSKRNGELLQLMLAALRPLVPQILEALARLTPGELIRIGN